MAYAKSSSERYERTEINSSTSYSRSSKSSKSMSSNQEMIGGGHQSIESNQQNRSYDFDDNYINEDERHDSGNHPITIRSFKSPAPNRKNMQSPVKDGYRKVTVSSGSNKIDHFSKSATFSDDDEDDSVFIDDQKTRYIDEVEVVAVDATHQESSGERSFEEMFEQKQEQHHNPQLIKGQLVKFQLNMANPDAHGSDQYHQQNKNIHQKQKTPEIQVEQYYTPPIQRSKNQFDTVNLTISEGSQRQQNMHQQQQSQQQHYHQNQNQQQQQQQQQQRQYPKQNKNQQIYEPVNLLISAEQQNRQQHQQHHQNQQHQQQRQQYQQHTQSQYEMRHDSDGEDQRHRYHPIQVELTHSKNKNNSYSPRDLPDYQPKKRPQNVKVETRSESEYSQSDFEAQTPVEVVYSPMPQRKRVHPKNIPIDITIARDGGHLKEPNSFRVLVSPTPHQNEIGFVPVHRGGSHQVYTVQEQNMSSQYQKDPPKIKPKPRKSYEQEVDPREVYDSFQGIEKDLYGQQQQRMRSMELRQVHAEPVQVQDVYHVTSGNEYHNKYQDQDQQNQTRTMHMSVRSSSQSIKKSKQRTSQQRVDQERRTSVEHQRMESARLKKLQQEEKEVQQRQEEAYQRQQKIEQRKRDEQQRKIKEYEEQKRREHEAEMRRREEIERRRREEEELRRRQEIEMKRREEKTRKREEVERRKREEQEIKIREEEIRRKKVQEEERKMAEQQKMEEIRIKEERMKKKKIQEQEEESFQQQQYQKSLQRSQSQKYFNENQINEVNMSSFPRHLKKKPYVVESVSANNTPNFAHQRKFHQGYSVSASNTPDVSRKSKKSASCYTCEHDEHDGKQRKSSSSFKSNVILGRTEMSERKAAVSQLIRPQSVDVTRQSKTLPRGFGRTKSQEWTTGMGQTNQRGQSYSTTTTTKTKNFSASSNTAQKFMQQSAKTDSRQMVQRPKSAHEFDKRSKHSYQKYTSKNDKQYSQQPFLDSPKEKYPIQEQQHNETFQPFTQQQLQKGHVVEYRNGSDVRIISGSHVTRDAKYDQANRMKNRDVVKSKAYTRLSRKDQQSADQQQQEKTKIIKQASEPKQNSSKDTYESIKVTAKGGVITLCMEEGEENKIPDSVKNRLTKSVYQHGYNDNAYYQQNQSSQYNYQSSSSQRMNSSDQQQSLQDEQSYQQLGYNYSHDDGRIQSGRYTKSSKKHDSNQTTESVYYTVCTRYFQPYNNDWITNIHRMGKAKVPVQGSHHQKCVFWLHLYDPDREEIIVQKIVPPPHLQGSIYYPSEYNANNSNSGGVFYDENNNIIDSISQVFDDSYEQLNTQQTRLNRSHEQNRRRGNRSYNNDVSLDSDGESRTSSICSNQSDASFKHSKPRLLRKSKEFPGARNEVDNSYQQSYAGNMQQVVY